MMIITKMKEIHSQRELVYYHSPLDMIYQIIFDLTDGNRLKHMAGIEKTRLSRLVRNVFINWSIVNFDNLVNYICRI